MDDKNAVLIVDDDVALLKMAGEILREGYAVSCVKSGQDAVALLSADYAPDIILLDVDMPGLNGYDTLARLRAMEAARDIPVVFLTGVRQLENEVKGLSAGAVDYITKPFAKEILLARLKVHLENGKQMRRLRAMQKIEAENRLDEEKFERLADGLTGTERKVTRLVVLGYSNQEIAETLSYSYNYIKKVVNAIYEKKYISRRSELKKMML